MRAVQAAVAEEAWGQVGGAGGDERQEQPTLPERSRRIITTNRWWALHRWQQMVIKKRRREDEFFRFVTPRRRSHRIFSSLLFPYAVLPAAAPPLPLLSSSASSSTTVALLSSRLPSSPCCCPALLPWLCALPISLRCRPPCRALTRVCKGLGQARAESVDLSLRPSLRKYRADENQNARNQVPLSDEGIQALRPGLCHAAGRGRRRGRGAPWRPRL